MAALEENSLSPWHLTRTDRETLHTATKGGERSLKRSEHRRMQHDTSAFQRDHHLRAVELQRRWLQLQERERKARLRNKQLLQEFERAQDTLRDMVTRTATMKTIRMEYERYLEESSPRWQQQLKEKTLSAQKRMEVYLTEYLKRIEEEQMMMSSAEAQPSLSQGPSTQPQKTAADKQQGYYSQNSCPHYDKDDPSHLPAPSMQSSWLTHGHPHSAGFPSRTPCQPQGSSHVPSAFHPLPSFQQPHRFTSTPSHHHFLPQPRPLGWTPLQMDHTRSWPDGGAGFPSGHEALWARPFMAEPPGWGVMQGVEVGAERSTGPSSERGAGRGGRSSGLSQELDVKPVRLSSESGRDSSQGSRKSSSREKRRRAKTGRTERNSSAGEEDGSQESSGASSTVVAASASVAHGSESDTSSGKGRSSSRTQRGRRRSAGLSVKPPRMDIPRERTSSEGDDSESDKEASPIPEEDSRSQKEGPRSERQGNQSPDNNSESCGEESGSPAEKSEKTEDEGAEGSEEQENSGANQSSRGDKDEEGEGHENEAAETDKDGDDDDNENEESSPADDEEEDKLEDDNEEEEALGRNSTAEEEEEVEEHESEGQEEDEEQSDREMHEGSEKDEDVSQDGEVEEGVRKGSADKIEEDEEESDEEEGEDDEEEKQRSQEPEEDRDSEDSIIVPQAPRSKNIIHSIPEEEEATGDEEDDDDDDGEEEGETESSDEFKDEDDDIESLLAPQAETQKKEENVPKAEDKPKAIVEDLENVSMELDGEKNTAEDDSDEFDHFYD